MCWESSAASLTASRGTRTAPKAGGTRRPKAAQTSSRRAEALHPAPCNPVRLEAAAPRTHAATSCAPTLQRCVLEAATLGFQAATPCVPGCSPVCSGCSPTVCSAGGLQPLAQDHGCGPLCCGVHAAVGRGDGAQWADDVRPTPQVRGAAAAEATGRDRGSKATLGDSGAHTQAWPDLTRGGAAWGWRGGGAESKHEGANTFCKRSNARISAPGS